MENINNTVILHDLLDYDSCRLISAEIQLKNSLNCWMRQASSLRIKDALLKYLNVTQRNILKIRAFMESENIPLLNLTNPVMWTLIEEANQKVLSCSHNDVKDICLLNNIQGINNFKTNTYRTAKNIADMLSMEVVASFFFQLQENENEICYILERLAKHEITNQRTNDGYQ